MPRDQRVFIHRFSQIHTDFRNAHLESVKICANLWIELFSWCTAASDVNLSTLLQRGILLQNRRADATPLLGTRREICDAVH